MSGSLPSISARDPRACRPSRSSSSWRITQWLAVRRQMFICSPNYPAVEWDATGMRVHGDAQGAGNRGLAQGARPAMDGRLLVRSMSCTTVVASSACRSQRHGSARTCSGDRRRVTHQLILLPSQSSCTATSFCRCISTLFSAPVTAGQSCFCATALETFAYTAGMVARFGALVCVVWPLSHTSSLAFFTFIDASFRNFTHPDARSFFLNELVSQAAMESGSNLVFFDGWDGPYCGLSNDTSTWHGSTAGSSCGTSVTFSLDYLRNEA